MTGYVVDEASDRWMVKLENDLSSTLWIKSLKYWPINGKYLNDKFTINFDGYLVDIYEPIRILLNKIEGAHAQWKDLK